jgi:hypothetical protein
LFEGLFRGGPWIFVLKALRGRLWLGSTAAHFFYALQVSDGTPQVGMARFISVFFQLGVEVQDGLCPLSD